MNRILLNITLLALASTLLAACSRTKEFTAELDSDDIGTQNITLTYFADDAWNTEQISALNGHFSIKGAVSGPTYFEVYTSSGTLLGAFIADGGDEITGRLSALNPENYHLKGNDDSQALVKWIADNRKALDKKDISAINRAVAEEIQRDPDRFLATALLLNYFSFPGYEKQALQLLQLIPEKYRPRDYTMGAEQLLSASLAADSASITNIRTFCQADSILTFTPNGAHINLLILTDDQCRAADSIRQLIATLRAGAPTAKQLRITDLGIDRDTLLWHSNLRSLPQDYPSGVDRLWLNEGPATEGIAPLAPTDIPYFILADSTGRVLTRTPSATAARAAYGQWRRKI